MGKLHGEGPTASRCAAQFGHEAEHFGGALKIINRDFDLLREPRRSEITAKRQAYVHRALAILRELDPHARSGDELLSASNLLLGMLNGIARRPFLTSSEDARTLAGAVGALVLYGFLERSGDSAGVPSANFGGEHDA